ncbi:hypothetical protein PbB2_00522 [Candidatus Phycosocius bacilliformis]|uniref:Uncharacterized protein n=1 Tax=Candidatus Phycosocius bacilliformis TaxID=1445552 RepID=A0A2P2E717_9PROT|nr:hypothetical protein [Candidatus Phycosocius bacilliformis]GBF56865.1 hypothetical protein PbB2_00522 [Candidatus Phycosocius bacilliformis]
MLIWMIWGVALGLYLSFLFWYENWRGPLKPQEIDRFLEAVGPRLEESGNSRAVLRAFLEQDDGREFHMLNVVKAEMGHVIDPRSGRSVKGVTLLNRYSRRFLPILISRGGLPAIVGRKVGGYIDAWKTPNDPGWTLFGLMRYRSRRDLVALATHPDFLAAHPEKQLGTAVTFSFPTQSILSLYAGPRVTAFLVLALAAALTQIGLGV